MNHPFAPAHSTMGPIPAATVSPGHLALGSRLWKSSSQHERPEPSAEQWSDRRERAAQNSSPRAAEGRPPVPWNRRSLSVAGFTGMCDEVASAE